MSEAVKSIRYLIGPLLNTLNQIYPMIGQFTPFVGGAFALYYVARIIYRYKEPLRVSLEKLIEEDVRLSTQLEKLQNELSFFEEKEKRIKERVGKASQAERKVLEAELESCVLARARLENELDTTLLRLRFIRVLQTLVRRREDLMQRGIWRELEDMMKGSKPALVKKVEKELGREKQRHQLLISCLNELEGLIEDVMKTPREVSEKRSEEALQEKVAVHKVEGGAYLKPEEEVPQEKVVVVDDEFLLEAKPQDWCVLFEEAVEKKRFIEIKARRGFSEEGYRSLLLAFLISELEYKDLSRLFRDEAKNRFILRALAFLKGLKEKGERSYEPTGSERVDADEVIRLLKEREEVVASEDPSLRVVRYGFSDPDGNRWVLSKEVRLDEHKRAKSIIYRLHKSTEQAKV